MSLNKGVRRLCQPIERACNMQVVEAMPVALTYCIKAVQGPAPHDHSCDLWII
jgi:hypothetical protein